MKLPSDITTFLCKFIETSVLTREPNQVIARHGSPYINRYMLGRKMLVPVYDFPNLPFGWAGYIPSEIENVYIHEFVRSDRDDPHNHPWPNVSILLRGWYKEDSYNDDGTELIERNHINPGDIVIRKASSVHAIIDTSSDCLSLFLSGKKSNEWGFWKQGLFIPWKDYHANAVM